MPVLRYVAAKFAQALFVVWGAYTVTFALLYVLPYDAVDVLFDPSQGDLLTAGDKHDARVYYGLDRSLFGQYAHRLGAAIHGDFGRSTRTGQDAWSMIVGTLPQTALLAVTALVLAVLLAAVVALVAAYTQRRWLAEFFATLPAAGVSVPVFLVGLAVLQVFSFRLGWFPPIGNDGPATLVLPAVTLAIPVAAPIARLLLENLDSGLHAGYVTVSLAKGATRLWVLVREVLRNAALPALTIAGVTFGNLLAGAVIVETVFSRSGLGRLTQTAVRTQDVAVVQGAVVLAALVFVIVNLVVDLIYPLLDPRLRTRLNTRSPA
ncbi:ABC transporter permease [Nocardia sp. BMG111209]|uniref:ABC transporter permease n=1 Tax=Nocardia sp. BMG111209 TaxID=1160137 RepID=UPI00036416DB